MGWVQQTTFSPFLSRSDFSIVTTQYNDRIALCFRKCQAILTKTSPKTTGIENLSVAVASLSVKIREKNQVSMENMKSALNWRLVPVVIFTTKLLINPLLCCATRQSSRFMTYKEFIRHCGACHWKASPRSYSSIVKEFALHGFSNFCRFR